jgi:hypothetical protein
MATDMQVAGRLPEPEREPVLDPVDRVSEMLFGLFMTLTFVGAISVAEFGRASPDAAAWRRLAADSLSRSAVRLVSDTAIEAIRGRIVALPSADRRGGAPRRPHAARTVTAGRRRPTRSRAWVPAARHRPARQTLAHRIVVLNDVDHAAGHGGHHGGSGPADVRLWPCGYCAGSKRIQSGQGSKRVIALASAPVSGPRSLWQTTPG